MDQLDLLKQQWQQREQELPKLSFDDIYGMLLKKSSSVVKWIFFASLIEIAFWIGLNFLIPESSKTINEGMGLTRIFTLVNVIHFSIIIYITGVHLLGISGCPTKNQCDRKQKYFYKFHYQNIKDYS